MELFCLGNSVELKCIATKLFFFFFDSPGNVHISHECFLLMTPSLSFGWVVVINPSQTGGSSLSFLNVCTVNVLALKAELLNERSKNLFHATDIKRNFRCRGTLTEFLIQTCPPVWWIQLHYCSCSFVGWGRGVNTVLLKQWGAGPFSPQEKQIKPNDFKPFALESGRDAGCTSPSHIGLY